VPEDGIVGPRLEIGVGIHGVGLRLSLAFMIDQGVAGTCGQGGECGVTGDSPQGPMAATRATPWFETVLSRI
jgi:hypothetical protein